MHIEDDFGWGRVSLSSTAEVYHSKQIEAAFQRAHDEYVITRKFSEDDGKTPDVKRLGSTPIITYSTRCQEITTKGIGPGVRYFPSEEE